MPIQKPPYEVHTWFERNRAHVELRMIESQETVFELWDEDVIQAIEHGFLKPSDFAGTMIEYARHLGIIEE